MQQIALSSKPLNTKLGTLTKAPELTDQQKISMLALENRTLRIEADIYSKAFAFIKNINCSNVWLSDLDLFALENDLDYSNEVTAIGAVMDYFHNVPFDDVKSVLSKFSSVLREKERARTKLITEGQYKINIEFGRRLFKVCGQNELNYTQVLRDLTEARDNPQWLFYLLQNKALLGESFTDITVDYLLADREFESNAKRKQVASGIASKTRKALKDLGIIRTHSELPFELVNLSASKYLFGPIFEYSGVSFDSPQVSS